MHNLITIALALLVLACSQSVRRSDAGESGAAGSVNAGGAGASAGGVGAAGVGAAGEGGSAPSAGGSAGVAGSVGAGSDCFDPIAATPQCETQRGPRGPVVDASAIGEGVRFTGVSGEVLLAVRELSTESTQLIVHAGNEQDRETIVLEIERDAATQGYVAVDAVDVSSWPSGSATVALMCKEDSCALFGTYDVVDGAALRPLPRGSVPAGLGARGLTENGYSLVCAYGASGYACFDGSAWVLRELEGVSLRYMSTEGYWTMAGDDGALFGTYAESEQAPVAVVTGLLEPLIWGSIDTDGCWTAITARGEPVEGGCAFPSALPCDSAAALPRYISHYSTLTMLVTADGTTYRRAKHYMSGEHEWCTYPRVDGQVIDTSRAPCGLESNYLVLTSSALHTVNYWGEIACPIE